MALIAGGFDRGVDYGELAEALAERRQPTALITMGNAGAADSAEEVAPIAAATTRPARGHHDGRGGPLARASLPGGGVVLLSPAAPSFDRYHNWEERSDDFTSIVHALVDESDHIIRKNR